METGVPGPWIGAGDPSARLEGGWGGLAAWLEPGVVTDVPEVEQGPIGDEVPAAEAPEAGSAAKMSPWAGGTPPPRSMKRERSFFSRAWMSSGFPWDSVEASHLRKISLDVLQEVVLHQILIINTAESFNKNTSDTPHLASHSPQCVCVCPGRAAVWGWEWTKVGWTEGTLVVTGWSPTVEEEEEEEEGGGVG